MFLESLNRKKSMEMMTTSLRLSAVLPDTPPERMDQKPDIQQEAKLKQMNDGHCAEKQGEKELDDEEAVDKAQMPGRNKRIKVIH